MEAPMTPDDLRAALNPRHLAFFGGALLGPILDMLRGQDFGGTVSVINPTREAIAGYPCIRSIDDLPSPPDMAFLAVNRSETARLVPRLAAMGCKAATIHAGGFAELGDAGAAEQTALATASGDMALFGPNAPGFVNFLDGASAFMDNIGAARFDRGAAIVSQGGGYLYDAGFAERGNRFSYFLGLGNQCKTSAADVIEALLHDDRVSAIGLVLEGLDNAAPLARASALALQKGVPIVALKAARTGAGAAASASHTASLTGEASLWRAFFRRQGIVPVQSIAEMLETLKLFDIIEEIDGNRVFVGTGSGIQGIILADQLADAGFTLPQPSPAAAQAARAVLPEIARPANPQDVTMKIWGDGEQERRVYGALLQDRYDIAILLNNYPPEGVSSTAMFAASTEALIAATRECGTKAAIVATLPEGLPDWVRQQATAAGVAPLQGGAEAVAALAHVRDWTAARASCVQDGPPGPLLDIGASEAGEVLREWQAKDWLARAGYPVASGKRLPLAELDAAPEAFSFPVVAKLDAAIAHKTESGAVALNITDGAALLAAARDMWQRNGGNPGTDAILVEQMTTDAVAEMLVSLHADQQMGWVMTLGAGGRDAELLQDVVQLILPASEDDIRRALAGLAIARRLGGWRGGPAADVEALVAFLMALAADRELWHCFAEMELNPVLVRPKGKGVVIVDALARHNSANSGAAQENQR